MLAIAAVLMGQRDRQLAHDNAQRKEMGASGKARMPIKPGLPLATQVAASVLDSVTPPRTGEVELHSQPRKILDVEPQGNEPGTRLLNTRSSLKRR